MVNQYYLPTKVPDCYESARADFVQACKTAGYQHTVYTHPLTGVNGETLAIDVATTVMADATNLLIVISGTHGAEGYLGSIAQTRLLTQVADLNLHNTAVMCIHALNPYGFSFGIRVDENNVDINRNFVDFDKGTPSNDGYQRVHELLYHRQNNAIDITRNLSAFFTAPNLSENIQALTSGQHGCDNGLFFGGTSASWSRSTLENIVTGSTENIDKTVVIDIHTGLGKYGYGQPMTFSCAGSPELSRAKHIFGQSLGAPKESMQVSSDIDGNLYDGIARYYQGNEITPIALEFGTYPENIVLKELLTESILRNQSGAPADYAPLRDCFFVRQDDWLAMALFRSEQVISQALTYLEN